MDRRYVIAGLFFAAAAIMAVVLVYPAYQRMLSASRSVAHSQEEFNARAGVVKEISKLKGQYKQMEKDITNVFEILPLFGTRSISEFFIELEGLSAQSGVSLETVSFSQSKAKEVKSGKRGYTAVNARIAFKGSYENTKRFVRAIETNKHLMDVKDIALAPPQMSAGKSEKEKTDVVSERTDLFSVKISLDAYYQ
ncbi:type 4a pilus biogenesis protein PilO [Candidatus Azambacteria bacterium]|nr:type 4a pilus biogenesis protein PilO [Candidatus Azambacteria bacterium]MBI3685354.1 type 4a pilus biogenesis protein PilO [Candidatus Azambacteria bacterium]